MAGNGKKAIGLRKATTLLVHHASMYISLRSLLICNFTFCGGREPDNDLLFLVLHSIKSFRIQLPKNCQHLKH